MEESAPGTKTILFTDVEGSTGFRTRVGDEAAHDVLRQHEERVRELIERHGGREVKSLGDGFMAAFVSARAAVDCAVSVQRAFEAFADEGLRVRVGINAGDVREEAGDLYGTAVHAASRIAAAANGRQILISGVVKDLAGTMPGVEFVDRGLFWLKGFPDKWRLHEVLWSVRRAPTPSPIAIPHSDRTPFVGREPERADLRRLLDAALSGKGSLALIGGEPGLGKTRLAEEIAEEASQRGFLALTGRCYEMEAPPPFMPLLEVFQTAASVVPPEVFRETLGDSAGEVARLLPELRSRFPDIPAPLELPPEQERRYLLNSLREFLERTSRRRPLLLLLDDLHWADESSLLLLQHVAERLHEMPALLLGTYRDVELDVGRPLARTLDSLLRHRLARRIPLRRLAEEQVSEMLVGLAGQAPPPGLVQVVYGETEGNPFFVEEVFRHLVEEGRLLDESGGFREDLVIDELDVPEGVRLVVGRRLERLGEPARRALAGAAVIGRSFTFGLLQALEGVDGDTLLDVMDEAETARLVVASSEGREVRYRFSHELVRQTLLTGLSMPRRQRLHLDVANAIERVGRQANGERASELAHHLFQAGAAAEPHRAIQALLDAGVGALHATAFEDALRHLEGALALEPEDPAILAEVLHHSALAHRSLGQWEEALSRWRRAISAAEAAGDPHQVGVMCWEAAHQLAWATRWGECLELCGRGLAALGDRVDPYRARLLAMSAIPFSLLGQFDHAESLIDTAFGLLQELGVDEELTGYLWYVRTVHYWGYADPPRVLDASERAVGGLRSTGALWELAALLGFRGFAEMTAGDPEAARATRTEGEALARRLGHLGALLLPVRNRLVSALMAQSDPEEIEATLLEDLEICQTLDSPFVIDNWIWQGFLHFLRGDWEAALERFEAAAERPVPGVWEQLPPAMLLRHLAWMGHRERCLAMIDERWGLLPTAPGPAGDRFILLLQVTEALAMLGERERITGLLPTLRAVEAAGARVRPYDGELTAKFVGIAAAAAEDWAGAGDAFARAAELAEAIPSRLDAAGIPFWQGTTLLRWGPPEERDRAGDLLRLAIERYAELDMPRHAEVAERVLQEAEG